MPGLRKIAKMYGGLVAVDGKQAVEHKWDYAKDEPYVARTVDREEYDKEQAAKRP